MNQLGYIVDLSGIKLSEKNESWIHALSLGKFFHPMFGEVNVTADTLSRMVVNFNDKVRGIDLDIDYDHKEKTNEAAGWVRKAETRSSGLWLLVEWTRDAAQKIKDKAYRYFSAEFVDKWTDPKSQKEFKDVLFGGGITNRPFLKDLVPINLSELVNAPLKETKGNIVDKEALIKLLKLSETATDEEITAAITKLQEPPKKEETKTKETKKEETKKEETTKLDPEAVKLAETDPMVKALVERIGILETANNMSEVERKLNELNTGGKVAIAPAILAKVREATNGPASKFNEKLFEILGEFAKGEGTVQLGELGRSTHTNDDATGNDVKTFTDEVGKVIKANEKMTYADAVSSVAQQNPQLYDRYRRASYIREEV